MSGICWLRSGCFARGRCHLMARLALSHKPGGPDRMNPYAHAAVPSSRALRLGLVLSFLLMVFALGVFALSLNAVQPASDSGYIVNVTAAAANLLGWKSLPEDTLSAWSINRIAPSNGRSSTASWCSRSVRISLPAYASR